MKKLVEDENAIERIIRYSTYIWEINLTLRKLRVLKNMINSISMISVPSKDSLNEIEAELIRRRMELNTACKNLLLPILEGKNFGHAYLDRYSIGQSEIKEGYCLFQEITGHTSIGIPIFNGKKYVLFLVNYYDDTLGRFRAGELIQFELVRHILDQLKLKTGAYKTITKSVFNTMHDSIGMHLRITEKNER